MLLVIHNRYTRYARLPERRYGKWAQQQVGSQLFRQPSVPGMSGQHAVGHFVRQGARSRISDDTLAPYIRRIQSLELGMASLRGEQRNNQLGGQHAQVSHEVRRHKSRAAILPVGLERSQVDHQVTRVQAAHPGTIIVGAGPAA